MVPCVPPEASVVRLDRWQALSEEQREDFPPLFPDLVVELASRSDDPEALRSRMAAYIAKGAWLGWLLLTSSRSVEVGTPGQGVLAPTPARMLGNVPRLGAGAEFGGLALDLAEIWQA
jgi:Uma2 family endonuclease